VLNTALMSALGDHTFTEARGDRSYWGRLVESAVGAHLCNTAGDDCQVQYWRESPHEVDFVLSRGKKLAAIEVKSCARLVPQRGLAAFLEKFAGARSITVGEGGISLGDFLSHPARHWLE
jgi:predicted AAA+ superfamily ATPase